MQLYLLSTEFEIIFLNTCIALTKHTIGEELLEFLPRVDHMLRIIDMRKQGIYTCFELCLGLRERTNKLVIEEH